MAEVLTTAPVEGAGVNQPPVAPPNYEFLRPLVEQWLSKIRLAIKEKSDFDTLAEQCDSFYRKKSGFMWKAGYKNKYLGGPIDNPKFQITINKAFELVALFGPYLFWQYPSVYIRSEEPVELEPELFGIEPGMMQAMQQQSEMGEDGANAVPEEQQYAIRMYQEAIREQEAEQVERRMRNRLMEKYLTYSQREQPDGGLAVHAEISITEALVKGRSCLWPETYTFPGSDKTLTKRCWDTVDNLFIDPDAKCPRLSDAGYIIRRHEEPLWKIEDRFDLPRGMLKQYGSGSSETADNQAAQQTALDTRERADAKSQDRGVWWEIWSKSGVGTRLNNTDDSLRTMISDNLHDAFDDVVGDYAYVCVMRNVPFPLNAPSWKFRNPKDGKPRASDKEVRKMFEWRCSGFGERFPTYKDERWPVALLDFYVDYSGAWPIPPLAPAIGELTCLNVLVSAFIEQAYDNRKQIIGYLESAAKDVEQALTGSNNPALVPLNDTAAKSIRDVIDFLNRPGMNTDILDAIAYVGELFDKRTGLTEFMYAISARQSRTATDVRAKEEKASIRPEKMANDVARWITESADLEKFLAGWHVSGSDLTKLFGKYGAYFWDRLITDADPEVVLREMRATVEASDLRKPNRERLMANLQEMQQYMLPMLQQYAQDTGDTTQLNAFLAVLGEAMEQDIGDWALGEWRPQPSEEEMQMQEMQMQFEQAKQQTEMQIKQIEAQTKQIEMQQEQIELQSKMVELQGDTGEVQNEARKKQLELAFDRAEHQQELAQSQQREMQDQMFRRAEAIQELLAKREEARQKIEQMKREGDVKIDIARRQARAKPQTNGSKT